MKIAISYPPIINDHGQKAMVSQNRNVQYFKKPTYLLPVTYAQAATYLKQSGFDVYWEEPYKGKLTEFYPESFFMTPHVASTCSGFLEGCREDINSLISSLNK